MEFVDWLVEVGNAIWAFFGVAENSDRAVAIATVLGTVFVFFGGLWVVIKGLFRVFRPKPEPAAQQINMDLTAAAPSEPILQMTLAQFDAKQRDLRDEVTNRLKQAHAKDRDQLLSQLDEINARLREPQKALDEALVRVKDLENRLDREANRFGADRIDAAKAALADLDYSKAEELFEQIDADAAIAVQSAARAQYGLGEIAEARVDWAKAAQHYRRAAELDADLDTLGKAADFSERAGDYALALPLSDRAVTLAKAASPDRYSNALNDHALLLKSTGRYAEAEPLYQQAMQITEASLGTDHPAYASNLNNLALLLHSTGRHAEAEPLFRQAMQITKAALGADHPDHARDLNNLAGLLKSTGRYAEAEPLYKQAMQITKASLGVDHPDYAIDLNNLALLLHATGRYAEAEPLYKQAMQITEAALGVDHPTYASNLNNLAGLLESTGRYAEAEPLYKQAMQIDKAALGVDHPTYATRLNNLAVLYYHMARFDAALPLIEQALRIRETALPAGHPHIEEARRNLAAIKSKQDTGD